MSIDHRLKRLALLEKAAVLATCREIIRSSSTLEEAAAKIEEIDEVNSAILVGIERRRDPSDTREKEK